MTKWGWVTREGDKQASLRIGEGKFNGVVYQYGKVALPQESEINSKGDLPFKFEYDILETNGIPKGNFNDKFEKLVGDVLLHIIIAQSEDGTLESNNRTNNAQ